MEYGYLAKKWCDEVLPLEVCHSAAGFYIGTLGAEYGEPVSRESVEYYKTADEAQSALETGRWTQKETP